MGLPFEAAYSIRNVHQLGRRDFIRFAADGLKKIDRCRIEHRAKEVHTQSLALALDFSLPLPRRIRFLVEVVESAPLPEALQGLEIRTVAVDGYRIGCVSLKLQAVCPSDRSGRHYLHGLFKTSTMIAAHLGDEVNVSVANNVK